MNYRAVMVRWRDSDEDWAFAPHERPTLPGSPANPDHPLSRRIAYGVIAVLVGVTGGLGNALVAVNTTQLQGALGLFSYEIAWLPTAYVMTNVSINLLLIKFRQQYGLRLFTSIFTGLYALVTFAHLFVYSFASAIAVRAASGMAGAALSSLALYYMMQALPAKWRLKGAVIGIGIPQLATPLARLFSTELLAFGEWRTLYIFEGGLALITLAAVLLVRLPPSERMKTFEPLDFVSFGLFASGGALLCAVLGEGRYLWWTDTPWLGWALAASIPLILGGILLEYRRRNPLLVMQWLGTADIVRFIVVSIMVRIVLSEQTYAAVGLLNTLGFNNDQFHTLFTIVTIAIIAGSIASAVFLDMNRLTQPIMFAVALVAVGAAMDSDATNLTRPQQLYFSQALLAFSTTFFMGPALLFGLGRALQKGTGHIVSFIVLFGITQNLGGLIGSAMLGTFQIIREKAHSNAIVQHLVMTDPQVALRIQQGGAVYGSTTIDPVLRGAQGTALLAQQATREANILAYNDVFQLIALLAAATTIYLGFVVWMRNRRARRAALVPAVAQ
jgi:MFS family permease